MRLVSAEFLKLYKRTGIVLCALGLTMGPALILMLVTEGDADSGGMRAFADQIGIVAVLSLVGGILVGATLGTSDISSGVFRDLVVTGRSRLDLYTARVPAGLVLVLVAAAGGFAIVVATAHASAGSSPATFDSLGTLAPATGIVVKSGLWLALVTVVGFLLAFGVSSLVGTASGSIAILLGLWLGVTPLLQGLAPDSWLVDSLVISGLDRLMPSRSDDGRPGRPDVAHRGHRDPRRVDDDPVPRRRVADDDAGRLAAAREARRRPVADLEPHEVGAAPLEPDVDPLARDALAVDLPVRARVQVDVEVVAERRAHEPAAGEEQRRDRVGKRMPARQPAQLGAVDLDEHGVGGALARQHRGGPGGLQVARRHERDRDDQPEQDQPPIHATDSTPDGVRGRT